MPNDDNRRTYPIPPWVRDLLVVILLGLSAWTVAKVHQLTIEVAVMQSQVAGSLGQSSESITNRIRMLERLADHEARLRALEQEP